MLIGLAKPKRTYVTVKLWGGDCEAKCLKSFPQEKLNRVSFRFTPILSNIVVVITEETDFNNCNWRSKLYDSNKGKMGIRKSGLVATVVAIRAVVKKGLHCIDLESRSYFLILVLYCLFMLTLF